MKRAGRIMKRVGAIVLAVALVVSSPAANMVGYAAQLPDDVLLTDVSGSDVAETPAVEGTVSDSDTETPVVDETVTDSDAGDADVTVSDPNGESTDVTVSDSDVTTPEGIVSEGDVQMENPIALMSLRNTGGEGGLIAHYTFEGLNGAVENNTQIEDKSGSGNHATLYGNNAKAAKGTLELPGGANGSDAAYVQLPTGMFDGQETLTISLWLQNPMQQDNYSAMFFGNPPTGSYPTHYWLLNPRKGNGNFKSVITNDSNSGSPWSTEVGAVGMQTSSDWGLYTTVITPNSITGYYNGEIVGMATKSIAIADFGEDLVAYIGKSSYSDPYYKGSVRDVRVYAEEFDETAVKGLYEGMLAHYTFEDIGGNLAGGTLITDKSGNNNHGVLRGAGASASNGELSLPGGASGSDAAYVELPTGMFDGQETLTISVWLENGMNPGNYAAMYFGTDRNCHNNQYPQTYWLLNPCTSAGTFKSAITKEKLEWEPYKSETPTSTTATMAEWGMYTTVISPNSIVGYYNGEKVEGGEYTGERIAISEFGENLLAYIGKSSYLDDFYKGKVKDVRVYTTAFNADQIKAMYDEAKASEQPQEGGLMAHYTFEGLTGNLTAGTQIDDKSGNELHAMLKGNGASAQRGMLRLPGGAKGSDAAYVELPTGMFDGKESLTISIWLQNATGSGDYAAMFFGRSASNGGMPLYYWLLNPCKGGNFKSVMTNGTNAGEPYKTETAASSTPTSNTWALYTTVIKPGSITGYYNGKLVSSAARSMSVADFGEDLVAFIGRSSYNDIFYSGQVRDVQIWDLAMTKDEVAELYETTKEVEDVLPTSSLKATKVEPAVDTDEVIGLAVGEKLSNDVKITMSDGTVVDGYISWDKDVSTLEKGEYTVNGVIDYYPYPFIEERADPQVYLDEENHCYYFTSSWPAYGSMSSGYNKIVLRKADTLTELASAEEHIVWTAHTSGQQRYHIWAPELHKIGDAWYIYYAASTADNGWGINCFVLKCEDGKDLTKAENWVELDLFKDENGNAFGNMCLDMTFFEANGKSYVIWADKNFVDNCSVLKIGEIDPAAPNKLKGPAVILTMPQYDWELVTEKVNEGPAVFKKNGTVYVTFSASATGVEYCVGLMHADEDADLMDINSWTKYNRPVLSSADTAGEYGPGHNSFTYDANGNLLMVYHARDEECYQNQCEHANSDPLYDPCRNALIKYVRFTEDGFPIFSSTATKELGDMRNITVTVNVGNVTESEKLQADLDAIELFNIDDVRGNITLPTVGEVYGNTITWTSDKTDVISDTGIVNRQSTQQYVTLTATITSAKDANITASKEFEATVVKKAQLDEFTAYLFAYFTGEDTANGEQIYFATSTDGLHWSAYNDGQPVLVSTLGEKGLRDPFIMRSPEGDKFYLIATDLRIYNGNGWGAAQDSGSRSIMVWESTDLVNWSDQRMIEVATEGAGCTWAPEAFYNDATGEYIVFWSSKIPDFHDVPNNDYTHRVYYATTRDFNTFSEPQVWIELHNPSDRAISVIDATVIKVGDVYYRFTKNEATEPHKQGALSGGKYTILEKSTSLLGNWEEIDTNLSKIGGVEGATSFKFNGEDKWCLLLDDFGGKGYFPLVTEDIGSGEFTELAASEYSFPGHMRHGSVISLTQKEYETLCPPATKTMVDDMDDSLTYTGVYTHNEEAGNDYYRRTLTKAGQEWTKISHTDTTTTSGTLNKIYYQNEAGEAWSYNDQNAWAGKAGEYYELTFVGTDVELYAYCNPDNGDGIVYIDGQEVGTLSCNSQSWEDKVVFSYSGLTSGQHTVKVAVKNTNSYLSFSGAKVCDKKTGDTSVSGSFTGHAFKIIGEGSQGTYDIYVDGQLVDTQTNSVYVKNLAEQAHTYKIVVKTGFLCIDAIEYYEAYTGEPDVNYELEDAIYQLNTIVEEYALTDAEKQQYSPSSLAKFEEAYGYAKKVAEGWGEQTLERIQSYTSKLEKKYAGLQAKGTPVHYTSFTGTNGDVWLDTDGTEIQAHGGQVLPVKQADGSTIYYWYGEDKTDGYRTVDGGVRVYSSTDLYNWKSEGIAMRNLTDKYDFEEDYFKDLYEGYTEAQKEKVLLGINDTTSVIERPKVIYNETTGKYIMWFHADGPTETSPANYAAASAGVAVSDSPTGPFRYIDRYRLHYVNGAYDNSKGMARDMNLFVDDDGKAYIIYSSEENQTMFISLLNDDYTALAVDADTAAEIYDETGEMSGFNRIPCYVKEAREAPALFKYDGQYYLITSGCTGWGANPAAYAVCTGDSPLDDWTDMGNPFIDDKTICKYGANLTFGSQSTSVLAVNPEKGEYIYMGDRWNNVSPGQDELIDPKYIWLPIQFSTKGEIFIYPKNDWTLDDLGVIQYAVETAEPMDDYIAVNGLDTLPTTMDFVFEGETFTSDVKWEVASGNIYFAGSLVTVKATLLDFKEGKTTVEKEMLVVSEDLLYLVDCAITADSGHTSAMYELAAEQAELLNDAPDAKFDTAKGWGYDNTTIAGTKDYSASYGTMMEAGYYGDNSKFITYYVTLDAGEYDLVSGHYEWWNTSRRHTDVKVSYTMADNTKYEKLIGTAVFGGTMGEKTQVYGDFTVEEDDTVVAITFAKAGTSIEAGTVAFFGVANHYEAPVVDDPEEDKPAVDTPSTGGGSSDSSDDEEINWEEVKVDVQKNTVGTSNATVDANLNYVAKGETQVPTNVLSEIKGEDVTVAFQSGNGVALSISGEKLSGVDVNKVQSVDLTVTQEPNVIPDMVVASKPAIEKRELSIRDKGNFGVAVDMHVNVGKENAGKIANLYRYNHNSGKLEFCSHFVITDEGQSMFAIYRGGDYMITVTDTVANETVWYFGGEYTVQAGDNLSAIAVRYHMPLSELVRRNPQLANLNLIKPGQKLNLR